MVAGSQLDRRRREKRSHLRLKVQHFFLPLAWNPRSIL
jgi:hypothetical protein